MKSPQEILSERLKTCYGFPDGDAAECARTLLEDLSESYCIVVHPYLDEPIVPAVVPV